MKSGQVGNLVANDFRSTIILAPLMETHPETGEPLNFGAISNNSKNWYVTSIRTTKSRST